MAEILKDHELPLKKQKLSEYHSTLTQLPYNVQHIQQIYASLDPVYIHQCLQEFSTHNRHLSAFKPVVQSIKESKIRHANAMGRFPTDPPVLQNPERVVLMSESERFERTYQPNVALAPPTPKKHRYGKGSTEYANVTVKTEQLSPVKVEPDTQPTVEDKKPVVIVPVIPVVESTVSVVRKPKYNPEIELSTDTEDSASETSEKHDINKLEDWLKDVDRSVKDKVMDLLKNLTKENERLTKNARVTDERLKELEYRNVELLKELNVLKLKNSENNHDRLVENGISKESSTSLTSTTNGSSIITSTDGINSSSDKKANECLKKSVIIASVVEQKEVIVKTAPE